MYYYMSNSGRTLNSQDFAPPFSSLFFEEFFDFADQRCRFGAVAVIGV